MSDFVNTIDVLGDQATTDAIVSRTITEFRDNVLTEIYMYRFRGCTRLTAIDLPNVTKLGGFVFCECTGLESVNVPKLTTGTFTNCSSLKSITLPMMETIADSAFDGCTSLEIADLAKATSIGSYAFEECKSLKAVILRESALCTLSTTNAFRLVPQCVTVYVPYDWIDAYENATNWSSLVSQGKVTFEALEGSGYD